MPFLIFATESRQDAGRQDHAYNTRKKAGFQKTLPSH